MTTRGSWRKTPWVGTRHSLFSINLSSESPSTKPACFGVRCPSVLSCRPELGASIERPFDRARAAFALFGLPSPAPDIRKNSHEFGSSGLPTISLLNTAYLKPLLWLRVIHARTPRAEALSHIYRYRTRELLGSGPRYVARNQVLPKGSVMVAARSPYGAV